MYVSIQTYSLLENGGGEIFEGRQTEDIGMGFGYRNIEKVLE